jgi:hypothetical protein
MRAKEFLEEDGIGGQFIKGMTGGQASSLGGLAKLGAANVAGGLGLNTVAGNIRSNVSMDTNKIPPEMKNMSVKQLVDALGIKVGQGFYMGQQFIKVTRINSDGIEAIDAKSHMPVNFGKEALALKLMQAQGNARV